MTAVASAGAWWSLAARAEPARGEAAALSIPGSSAIRLPPHIHRKANGRYVRDMCTSERQRIRCLAKELLPETWHPGDPLPAASPKPLAGPQGVAILNGAYSIPSSAAANGKIVAILDAPDSHALADLALYRQAEGIAPIGRCDGLPTGSGTACFAQVAEDGSASTNTDPSAGSDGETSLDTDMISLACPDCSILLVEVNPNFCERDLVAGAATAAKLGASAISISLGGPEATDPNAASIDAGTVEPSADAGDLPCPEELTWTHDLPGPYSTPGHPVFAASGDFAFDNANLGLTGTLGAASPSYPASSPYVIAVGGTALYATGTTYGEGVWDDGRYGLFEESDPTGTGKYQDATTSGCSTEFAMPPWQVPVLAGTGCNGRATADVSAVATFFSDGTESGISIVVNGNTVVAEGTSASSPVAAALFTRLGLTTEVSNDLSWLYTNASAFNDVGSTAYPLPAGATSSDAPPGSTCGILCTAAPDWDGPSGVGTPNGTNLAALPVSTAGPQAYPDAGVCGPYGACNAGPPSDDAGAHMSALDASVPRDGGGVTSPVYGGGETSGLPASSTGCGCRVEGAPSKSGAGWAVAALVLTLTWRRRRQAGA